MKKQIDLCKQVRKQGNLMRAWHQVERRVAASKDKETQKALIRFRENPTREIARLSRKLRDGSFVFEQQRGYPKPRRGKRPRPIVVAPIANRIVQRTILDICQSDDPEIRKALGDLPRVIDCETSVGGLPNRGVPEAIGKIRAAIKDGARWYVRSDLINFFTTIRKPAIEAFLKMNIDDLAFVDLFMKALATELSNEADIRDDIDLFPLGDDGVPQGSALSALCANIVLSDFDRKLNGRNVTTIRYLDDFVILAPSRKASEKAWLSALKLLESAGLKAHDPAHSKGKAAKGEVANGFDFLSFYIDNKASVPSKEARTKFIQGISDLIRQAKKDIQKAGAEPRRAQPAFIQTLSLIDKKIRGWGDAFGATSQRVIFAQLDKKLETQVEDFMRWFKRQTTSLDSKSRRRALGIALLSDTPSLDL